jgi:hypothetical protein
MDADELIARLAAEGELDSTGGFTLDPEVALDKLREFQLRDPARFVLSWVRAAILLGATRIDVEIDADDVFFRFDGEALTGADFDNLWSSVVGTRGSAKLRACRELALGINGAFSWQAKAVTISSGGEKVGFDRSFAMSRTQLDAPAERTVVHARRPLGWDLIRRRLLDSSGELPEELLLATACAHASVPIHLEGTLLNPEQAEAEEPWIRLVIDDDERQGTLRLRPGSSSRLRVLVVGIEVEVVDLGPEGLGLCEHGFLDVVVDDPLLPLDLSQEKIVEGPRWQELLACISRVRWRAWFTVATREGWPRAPRGPAYGYAHEALQADIFACPDLAWLDAPGAMKYADQLELPRAVSDPLAGFVALGPPLEAGPEGAAPIELPWPRPAPEALTLGELVRSARARDELFTCPRERDDLAFDSAIPVLLGEPPRGLRAFGHVVLDRPANVARYLQALTRVRELDGERELGDGWFELRHQHDDLRVRVAWRRGADLCRGALVVGSAGKRLAEFHLPERWGPLWAEVEGPFEDGPADYERLTTALLALLERYHDLLAGLVGEPLSRWERELVTLYLREAVGHWSALRLAEVAQIPVEVRARALASWAGGWGVPPAWVDPPPDERAACDHPVMNLAWLERHGGRSSGLPASTALPMPVAGHVSLRDIRRELASAGALAWVERGLPFDAELPAEVWRLDARERAIIADVFHGALDRYDLHAAARAEPGTHTPPSRLENARRSVELIGLHDERGILGLPAGEVPVPWSRPPGRGARVLVLQRGHDLGWMDVPLPVGPFYGVLEIPEARALPHADAIAKDEAWRAAAAVVAAGAKKLARAQLDAWIAGEHGPDDPARVSDWSIELERGGWPELAAAWHGWQAGLAADHPLRVDPQTTRKQA